MRIRARFDHDLVRDIVRLHVVRDGPTRISVLMEDGSWQDVDEGAGPVGSSGLPLPAAVIPEIGRAAAEYLGNALPSQAEVSVLREWLAVEQRRVDAALSTPEETS